MYRCERGFPFEIGIPGEFDAYTDDELERALVERFRALGLTLGAGKR